MGKGKRPSLRSERVQNDATPGDLHWLLVNGSLQRGMPSWSKLPDQQLWHIITYVKSLKSPPP
jgi:mono/diheme cytochrome c family protein